MSNAEFAARGIEAAKAFMERRDYEIEAVDWKCDAQRCSCSQKCKRERIATKASLLKLLLPKNAIEWSASR